MREGKRKRSEGKKGGKSNSRCFSNKCSKEPPGRVGKPWLKRSAGVGKEVGLCPQLYGLPGHDCCSLSACVV